METFDFSFILMLTILFVSLMLIIFGLYQILKKRNCRSGFLFYNYELPQWKEYCKKKI